MEKPRPRPIPNDPLLRDIYKSSEYMTRHLPLAGRYFAQFMGILQPTMPEEQVKFLQRGAELHDIGKRAAVDILEKPIFSQQERELMHWHPQIGASFLRSIYGRNHPYVFMAESHHERWDGKGYPNQARGESIPYYGRVMALADIFSTVTQPRPYEAHVFTPIEALSLLEQEAGRIFDPNMVRAIVAELAPQLT